MALVHLAVVAGLAVAIATVIRMERWPAALRAALAAVGVYGIVSILLAAATRQPFGAVFTAGSFWRALPIFLQGAALAPAILLPVALVAAVIRAGVRRPVAGSAAFAWFRVAVLAVASALVVSALPLRSSPRETPAAAQRARIEDPAERVATLDKGLQALEQADREMPRDRWDPAYLVAQVGKDPKALFDWVRGHTQWVPYEGALRGPAGVLMDGQGNSLDRSLLLAELLTRAGRTVRMATADLPREAAIRQIARAMALKRRPVAGSGDAEVVPDLAALSAQHHFEPAGVQSTLANGAEALLSAYAELERRVAAQLPRLAAAVPRPPGRAEWQARYDASVRAAAKHWWVQMSENGNWIDLDPADGSETFGRAVAVPSSVMEVNALPAPLLHEVTLRLNVARQRGGSVTTAKVFEHVLRPRDLVPHPVVTLQLLPARWPADPPSPQSNAVRTALLEQDTWVAALFVGGDVITQGTISALGTRQPATGGAGAGGFGGIGGAMGSALKRGDPPADDLRAAYLEFEIRTPGENPRTIRRDLFDFSHREAGALGEDARVARALALMTRTEILPLGWELAPDYASHLAVASLVKNRELLRAGAVGDTAAELPERQVAPVSPLFMLALARFEWSRVGDVVFQDRINVFARHTTLVPEGESIAVRAVTDIVANQVGVDLEVADGFAARLEQGVVDTNTEALLGFGQPLSGNTADAFDLPGEWVTLRPGEAANRVQLDAAERARLSADLAAGLVVVSPAAPVTVRNAPFTGWWRIDPQTGSTLGVAGNGHGQAIHLVVAMQSSGETSVHYNVLVVMARGFIFEEAFCRTAPYAFVAARPIWMFYINSLAPEWWIRTLPPPAPDVKTAAAAGRNMCIFGLMLGGVLATLPLVMMTLRFATLGRIAVSAGGGAGRLGRNAGRMPRPERPNRGARPNPPRRPAPGSEPAPPPAPKPGNRGPRPREDCPADWGGGRTPDGTGNYPPNTPGGSEPSGGFGPVPEIPPAYRGSTAAEDAAHLDNLKGQVPQAQAQFDEALARYREAVQREAAAKQGDDLIEKVAAGNEADLAEGNLANARYQLGASKQRVALYSERYPAMEEVRAAEAKVQRAMENLKPGVMPDDPAFEDYLAATRELGAARDRLQGLEQKKLGDYPVSVGPSPGGAAGGAPAPGGAPDGSGGACGGSGGGGAGAGSSGGAGAGAGGAGAAGGRGGTAPMDSTQPDLGYGATLPDYGKTMPAPPAGGASGGSGGGQPGLRTLVGLGGMIGTGPR